MAAKIFISYKAEEFSQAEWIRRRLTDAGFLCWMAPGSIPGGAKYAAYIPQAIRSCDIFVVVLSNKAQQSMWVPKELNQAINAKKKIMPFFIENCSLHDDFDLYLCDLQRYDAWKDREGAISELIRDISAHESQQSPQIAGTSEAGNSDIGTFTFAAPGEQPESKKQGLNKLYLLPVIAVVAALLIIVGKKLLDVGKDDGGAGSSETALTANTLETDTGTETETEPQTETSEGTEAGTDAGSQTGTETETAGTETGTAATTETAAGTGTDAESQTETAVVDYNTDGEVRILNKKYAQDLEFQHLARRFEEESGIKVTVKSPAVGKYTKTLDESMTGSRNDPTLFMLSGLNDFEKYGSECLNLTDSAAAGELVDDSYKLEGQNGRVYGLACIVESYGLCVNTRLLKKAGYEASEIRSFRDLKRIVEDITRRKDELGFSAFTSPSVGIGASGDYRFAEHAPAVPLYYELKDYDFNTRLALHGTYMDCFRDYIDLYLDHAAVPRSQASERSLDDAQEEFLTEKAVFHQDGSWNMDIIESIMKDQGTVIPLYMGMPGEEDQGLNKTCSYFWCVNKYASEDDKEATLQFLYWLVTSDTGIEIMTDEMGFQIPYRRATVPDNVFLEILHEEEENGMKPINQYYKYGDYDTWINGLRRNILNYANGSGSWASVEEAYKTLW